ncbi:MAG: T9SS type A sorting domain-containing protein [Bacteroidota bacterium]
MNATASGTSSGNIAHTGTSAPAANLPVTGNAIPIPLITLTGTLATFTQVLGVVSPVQTYTVTGANLTGNITITAPADYEISSNGGTNWSTTPLVLTQTGGAVAATTISIRLNSVALGAHSGNVTHVSSGAASKNMAVTGVTVPKPVIIVTQTLGVFTQTVNGAMPVQSYTVEGTNLTGNIIITPPAHFQVSTTNGSSWQSTAVTLTRTNGAVPPTTILLRLYVPVTGMFSGILSHTSSDADAVNVTLNGYNKVTGEYVIYPVPVTRTIFIAHPITTEKAVLTFYNAAGQYMATYSTQPNTIETPIDVSNLPQGLYYVEYRLANTKVMLKFIKG